MSVGQTGWMMRKTLLILTILLIPAAAVAGDKFGVVHTGDQYIRLLKGTESGIERGTTGELLDARKETIGGFVIIDAVDSLSIARVKMSEGRLLKELDRVDIGKLDLLGINFRFEDSDSYFQLDKGRRDGIRVGGKGKLLKGDKLIGYFRVIAVDENTATGVAYQLDVGVDYKDAERGEFQDYLEQILGSTGFVNLQYPNLIMIIVGLIFIYLAIAKEYEPLLLLPIGFGILIGNIPLPLPLFNSISVYMIDPITHQYTFNTTTNSVFGIIYSLVTSGVLPPIIFLGIGAMTDFSTLLSNPKTVLLGAAAQLGIFGTFLGALWLGFNPQAAASIGIIGGADGPTAIFLTSKLAPTLIGPVAIAAYSYMGLIPIIQPPVMRLLTNRKERLIRMKPGRKVSKLEKITFPIVGFLVTTIIAPGAIPLLGMLFFGNLLKESGVTARLAKTAANPLIDIATILLGVAVGASTTAQVFLNAKSILIFTLGCIAFVIASAFGIVFAKFMNLFLSKENKINPLIGSAGVSAVPDSARVSEIMGRKYDPENHLLMHAMGPNVAGVIGSAIAAGILLGIF
jgi:sodium ion-translocating decarboxylase beta subunit